MPRYKNDPDDGHFHNQKRTDESDVQIGRELVTTRHTYCTLCGKWMTAKVIKRQRNDGK